MTTATTPKVGALVEYHGSLVEAHGRYRVVEVRPVLIATWQGPMEWLDRLVLEPVAGGPKVRRVRPQSVTVVEEEAGHGRHVG